MKSKIGILGLRFAFATFGLSTFLALNVPTVHAVGISYTLTLTEVSSTVLTATYTGPSSTAFSDGLNNIGTDLWIIQVLDQDITLQDFEYNFLEPENPLTLENNVSRDAENQGTDIFVRSDFPIVLDSGYFGTTTQIGTEGGVPILLQFIDLAAASETASNGVPESGSSLTLLALSSAALVGLTRLRRRRSSSVES